MKVVYVDTNQFDQLILSLDSCAYHGPCLQEHPWVDEAQLMQAYRVTDMLNPHIPTFVAPVRDNPMHELHYSGKYDPMWNDSKKCVMATVNAFHNQVAQKLIRSEPPLLGKGRGSMQLPAEYFAPQNLDHDCWSSFRNKSFLVADQKRSSQWVTCHLL